MRNKHRRHIVGECKHVFAQGIWAAEGKVQPGKRAKECFKHSIAGGRE